MRVLRQLVHGDRCRNYWRRVVHREGGHRRVVSRIAIGRRRRTYGGCVVDRGAISLAAIDRGNHSQLGCLTAGHAALGTRDRTVTTNDGIASPAGRIVLRVHYQSSRYNVSERD